MWYKLLQEAPLRTVQRVLHVRPHVRVRLLWVNKEQKTNGAKIVRIQLALGIGYQAPVKHYLNKSQTGKQKH